jgi:hypothetical protein
MGSKIRYDSWTTGKHKTPESNKSVDELEYLLPLNPGECGPLYSTSQATKAEAATRPLQRQLSGGVTGAVRERGQTLAGAPGCLLGWSAVIQA